MNQKRFITKLIAYIDKVIKKQLLIILDSNVFKDLLSTWSALYYITQQNRKNYTAIKILDLKWQEVISLIHDTSEFDNPLSQKILDEFDLPGNDPISLIIGNYLFDLSNKKQVDILSYFGKVAAYVFAPFISSITYSIFGLDNFAHFTQVNLDQILERQKFKHFAESIKTNEASFIGLIIPKVFFPSLISIINKSDYSPLLGLDINNYKAVLGNGAFIFAALAMISFCQTGWFLEITEKPINTLNSKDINSKTKSFFANTFPNLPFIFFKCTTEFLISEHKEKELMDLGFMSLCHIKHRDSAVLYNANSLKILHAQITDDKPARIACGFQYILCISRFAHYIKILGRQKLGRFSNSSEFEDFLNKWLLQYIASDIQTPLHLKHKYPLLDGKIEVRPDILLKDNYLCMMYLKPHLIPTRLSADIVLKTKIATSLFSIREIS